MGYWNGLLEIGGGNKKCLFSTASPSAHFNCMKGVKMFGKKEATPGDIAGGLEVFLKIDAPTFKAINNISSDPSIQEKICFEIFLLVLFSIDNSLYFVLGNSKEKAAIMDHILVNFLKKVPEGDPAGFIDLVNQRQIEYARAFKTPHHLGTPYVIGKKFSEFISDTTDLKLSTAYLGSVVFTTVGAAVSKMIRDILKKYKIKL
jgi:hypothetical protein